MQKSGKVRVFILVAMLESTLVAHVQHTHTHQFVYLLRDDMTELCSYLLPLHLFLLILAAFEGGKCGLCLGLDPELSGDPGHL